MVLQLPICQNRPISGPDTLFTAASAISTTGLSTVDIGKAFSPFGQSVLLILAQMGGIGYMTLSAFIVLQLKNLSSHHKKQPYYPFSLSSDRVQSLRQLIQQAIYYTLVCEAAGAIALYFFFQNEGVENSPWNAIFHSISAFSTTGFSLFPSNMEGYRHHLGINAAVSLLSMLGAFGFLLYSSFLKGSQEQAGIIARITRTFPTVTIAIGTMGFLLLTNLPVEESAFHKLLISLFQTISAFTTVGFNTINMGSLSLVPLIFLTTLMLFAAALTGNGMNTKNTSWFLLLKRIRSMINGSESVRLRGQNSVLRRVYITSSTFLYYSILLLIPLSLLILTEKLPFFPLLFETASALCTVGFSTGITAELSLIGKGLITFLMLTGRIGILILGFAISTKDLPLVPRRGDIL